MWIFSLAWKNLWRNKTRTLITMSAVFFAVILSVFTGSLKDGIFENLVKNVVSFHTGYIQIHKKGYTEEQVLDNGMVLDQATKKRILDVENVAGVALRLENYGLIATGTQTKGCLVTGIDPDQENKVTSIKDKIIEGSFESSKADGVWLSEGLAKRLKVVVADTVFLIGQGYHGATSAGRFVIQGILKFASPDLNDQLVYLSISSAMELYSAPGISTTAVISLKNPKLMNSTVNRLQQQLVDSYEVNSWETILPEIKQHIETDSNSMKYIQGILYMLVSFGIFGTLLMMMLERNYEIAMLIAIGMKKSRLYLMIVIESVLTVLGGCITGLIVSIPVVWYFNKQPLRMSGEIAEIYQRFGFEPVFPTSVAAENFIFQGLFVLVLGLLLSLYPVYKVWKMDPVTALKK